MEMLKLWQGVRMRNRLESLMDREQDILLFGPLEDLWRISSKRESLVRTLPENALSASQWKEVLMRAKHLERLLQSCLEGLEKARSDGLSLTASHQFYTREGKKTIPSGGDSKLSRTC